MRKITALAGAVCAGAMLMSSGAAMATEPDPGTAVDFPSWKDYVLIDGHKVTFCHRTGSAKNPYIFITSDLASVDDLDPMTTDHQHHVQVGNGIGPDIIPISDMLKKDLKGFVPVDLCFENPYPYAAS
jgi:hypothetical protein